MVRLKYLTNLWRTLEIALTNYEINLVLTWSANCVISNAAANKAITFAITDTKLYVLVVTLSTDDNGKLLQQSKLGFKRTINWDKYQSKVTRQAQNWYLQYSIGPIFQGVNRHFVLSFLDGTVITRYGR